MAERARQLPERAGAVPTPPSTPTNISVRSVSLSIIAVAAAMYILQWAQEVFIPIVLSILISYVLAPIVSALMRLRLPRLAASALVVAMVTGAFGYTVYSLSDDAGAILAQVPEAAQKLQRVVRRNRGQ